MTDSWDSKSRGDEVELAKKAERSTQKCSRKTCGIMWNSSKSVSKRRERPTVPNDDRSNKMRSKKNTPVEFNNMDVTNFGRRLFTMC